MADRNFDDLADRFKRKVVDALKGEIRQEILKRDYEEFLPLKGNNKTLSIFDAGGGQGQVAQYFASLGHRVVLCDISENMLALAKKSIEEKQLSKQISLLHQSISDVSSENIESFDIVSCHAVLEWVDDPLEIIKSCLSSLKSGGFLSLTYYNINGLIYKNLLRTNFKKLEENSWAGTHGGLTPTSPLQPETVNEWIKSVDVDVVCESGIRVYYDYIFNVQDRARDPKNIKAMELLYSRQAPFKHLGRYIHLLLKKN